MAVYTSNSKGLIYQPWQRSVRNTLSILHMHNLIEQAIKNDDINHIKSKRVTSYLGYLFSQIHEW